MSDQWTTRLSEYLDDQLSMGERATLEAHLAACPACAATLSELRGVVARARTLEDRPPAGDLWPSILRDIRADAAPVIRLKAWRRISVTIPQLAAAGLALMLASGGAVWMLRKPEVPGAVSNPAPALQVDAASRDFEVTVAGLQAALSQGRGRLDSSTVRVLEQSLTRIDRAIDEASHALAKDPASVYLNGHLAQTRMRKLELLRRAVRLTAAAG